MSSRIAHSNCSFCGAARINEHDNRCPELAQIKKRPEAISDYRAGFTASDPKHDSVEPRGKRSAAYVLGFERGIQKLSAAYTRVSHVPPYMARDSIF